MEVQLYANCAGHRAAAAIMLLAALAACGSGGDGTSSPPPGSVRITVVTTGPGSIPSGYVISVDEGRTVPIAANGSVTVADLAPGLHAIRLTNIALQCTSDWYAAQSVAVAADSVSGVAYTLVCGVPLRDRIIFLAGVAPYSMHTDGTAVTPIGAGLAAYRLFMSPGVHAFFSRPRRIISL